MPTDEWARYCARQYIRAMAAYVNANRADMEHREELGAQLEAVSAIRYDREGGPSGYVDRRPEQLDRMEELRDRLAGRIEAHEAEYQDALALFNSDDRARMAWAKYGRRMTWRELANAEGWSVATCRRMAETGLVVIYRGMPREFKRAFVNSEDWT